jgi:hypothetical protein
MNRFFRSGLMIVWTALLILWCSWARAQSFVITQFRPDDQKRVHGYRMAEMVIFDQPWVLYSVNGITQKIVYPTGTNQSGAVACATMTPGPQPADPWTVTFDVKAKKREEERMRFFFLLTRAKAFVEKECR